MSRFSLIAAVCKNNGIGYKNKIPWNNKDDLKFFTTVIEKINKDNFNTRDVLKLIDKQEGIKEINFYFIWYKYKRNR